MGGVGELEEDGQVVLGALRGGLGQGEEDEGRREDLAGIRELDLEPGLTVPQVTWCSMLPPLQFSPD